MPHLALPRPYEITEAYLREIDKHLSDIVEGRTRHMLEIRDFAALLHIHPTHLTNTIKQTSGRTPCDFFEARILAVAQQLLAETSLPINEIAAQLTYDPSNFTKFFKRFSGMTPKQYRSQATASVALTPPSNRRKTEALTI